MTSGTIKEITSGSNATYRSWIKLLEGRGIRAAGQALLSGDKLTDEYLRQRPERAIAWISSPRKGEVPEIGHSLPQYQVPAALFRELDVLNTNAPLLLVETPALTKWQAGAAPSGLELIAPLSDPTNLGALLRSAEAFGIHRVILTQESASPFLPRALRASAGAALRLPLAQTSAPLAEVIGLGQNFYCLDMEGADIHDFAWPKSLFLVVGEEGRGLPNSPALEKICIPMVQPTESLNVTVAASIALFSYRRNHKLF